MVKVSPRFIDKLSFFSISFLSVVQAVPSTATVIALTLTFLHNSEDQPLPTSVFLHFSNRSFPLFLLSLLFLSHSRSSRLLSSPHPPSPSLSIYLHFPIFLSSPLFSSLFPLLLSPSFLLTPSVLRLPLPLTPPLPASLPPPLPGRPLPSPFELSTYPVLALSPSFPALNFFAFPLSFPTFPFFVFRLIRVSRAGSAAGRDPDWPCRCGTHRTLVLSPGSTPRFTHMFTPCVVCGVRTRPCAGTRAFILGSGVAAGSPPPR